MVVALANRSTEIAMWSRIVPAALCTRCSAIAFTAPVTGAAAAPAAVAEAAAVAPSDEAEAEAEAEAEDEAEDDEAVNAVVTSGAESDSLNSLEPGRAACALTLPWLL